MKYSFMSFSAPDQDFPGLLAMAGKYGYDGIEPRLDANHAHGIEVGVTAAQREAFRGQSAERGIALACLATSLKFADPKQTGTVVPQTHDRIDLAGDLGVPVLRIFGGKIPEGMRRDAAIEQVATCLATVAPHAAERGVTLALETHDDWCDPAHVAAVVSRVDHSAIAVNWDIMHPVRMGLASIDESYDQLKPWIRHLHVHDGIQDGGRLKMVPIGRGMIDHRRALTRLRQDGYTGFISGEWIRWEAPEQHLPRELATLKTMERDVS